VDAFKFGLNENRFVGSSDMGLYSRNGDIEDAYRVFDEIADKDVVYASMITGYAQCSDHRGCDRVRLFVSLTIRRSNSWGPLSCI
jgi:pentatricopeptide repeat protein